MTTSAEQRPAAWTAADSSERHSSNPRNLSVSFDPESQQRHPSATHGTANIQQDMGRRRSSFTERLHAIRTAGGPNSLEQFAKSWQRAATFNDIMPAKRRSFMYMDGDGDEPHEQPHMTRGEIDTSPMSQRSLLREQLARERGGGVEQDTGVFEDEGQSAAPDALYSDLEQDERSPLLQPRLSRPRGDSIFRIQPQLASPFGGSYGSTWGSFSSRLNEPAIRHAGRIFQRPQLKAVSEPDKEREPLIVKKIVEDDGTVVNVIVGQSTLPHTVFNSINVLVGVGLLALPLAMQYSGWVIGIGFLTFSGLATCYTAKLLAKCADLDSSLITFADLAYIAFGKSEWARTFVSVLFVLELIGACVALVILFADSLTHLLPSVQVSLTEWKLLLGALLFLLTFMKLSLLALTSFLGILCCSGIIVLLVVDGLHKKEQPGSLRQLALTTAFPQSWEAVPVALGILMSPWGGHSVFPDLYRDMRHPYRWRTSVNITYSFTLAIVVTMATLGWLMFGADVKSEITANIIGGEGYPAWVSYTVTVLVTILPITKLPLNARPVIATTEFTVDLIMHNILKVRRSNRASRWSRSWPYAKKLVIRLACVAAIIGTAIGIPDFAVIMSLMGALACFLICIILPCWFHLNLFWAELPIWHRALDSALITISVIMALLSTFFNFWGMND